MQSLYTRLSALIFCTSMCSVASAAACQAVLDHTFPALVSGKPQSLCDFSGKVVLVVNTASDCGYTPQYEGLEALYKRYEKRGLVVVGFPSNDFGGQEPASNKQVAQFCQLNYGVTFPMFEKTTVTGARANALYTDLTRRSGSPPQWNFHKYLVGRDGHITAAFPSETEPQDARIMAAVARELRPPAT